MTPPDSIRDLRDLRSLTPCRYRVRVVHYRRRGETTITDLPATFGSIASALREAERLQAECDTGAEAVAVYVIDDAGIPVRRAGDGA